MSNSYNFCWWGYGYCMPEAKPIPEPEPVVQLTSGFSLFDSGPWIVQLKSHPHSASVLECNVDMIIVLLMCIVVSSLVSSLVIYWVILPGLKAIQGQPAAVPVSEAYDLRKTKSGLEDDDEGGNKNNPNQLSMLDSLFDPVEGYYSRAPVQVQLRPDISRRKLPIISTGSFIDEPTQVIYERSATFIIQEQEPKSEELEEEITILPPSRVSSTRLMMEQMQRESKSRLAKIPSRNLNERRSHHGISTEKLNKRRSHHAISSEKLNERRSHQNLEVIPTEKLNERRSHQNLDVIPIPTEKLNEIRTHQKTDVFVLTLHQYPRGKNIPCMAPHGMKIETLLRLSEISHRVVFDANNSTGPWLSYGELKVCGSVQTCIKFLNHTFPRKMNWTVPAKKKVPAWFVTLLTDCHLYWGLNLWRWLINDAGKDMDPNQCENDMWGETGESIEKMRVAGWLPGIGEMSQDEIIEAVKNDLVCLAASLGSKKFFIGNSITDVDVAAFSLLSQMVYSSSELPFQKLIKAYPNLIRFCDHIRKDLWGDWDTLILDPEGHNSASLVSDSEDAKAAIEPKAVKVTRSASGHGYRSRSTRHRHRSRQNPQTRFTDKVSIKTAGSKRRSRSSRSKSRAPKQPVT